MIPTETENNMIPSELSISVTTNAENASFGSSNASDLVPTSSVPKLGLTSRPSIRGLKQQGNASPQQHTDALGTTKGSAFGAAFTGFAVGTGTSPSAYMNSERATATAVQMKQSNDALRSNVEKLKAFSTQLACQNAELTAEIQKYKELDTVYALKTQRDVLKAVAETEQKYESRLQDLRQSLQTQIALNKELTEQMQEDSTQYEDTVRQLQFEKQSAHDQIAQLQHHLRYLEHELMDRRQSRIRGK